MYDLVTHHNSSSPTLVQRDFVRRSLDLNQVERLALQRHDVAQDGGHFGQFVRVACDEVERLGSRARRGHCGKWVVLWAGVVWTCCGRNDAAFVSVFPAVDFPQDLGHRCT
jgi:hypothetical protein